MIRTLTRRVCYRQLRQSLGPTGQPVAPARYGLRVETVVGVRLRSLPILEENRVQPDASAVPDQNEPRPVRISRRMQCRMTEILLIGGLLIFFFGASRLPALMRSLEADTSSSEGDRDLRIGRRSPRATEAS